MMTIIESSRLQPNFRKSWAIRGTDLYVLLLQSQMHDPEASPLGRGWGWVVLATELVGSLAIFPTR